MQTNWIQSWAQFLAFFCHADFWWTCAKGAIITDEPPTEFWTFFCQRGSRITTNQWLWMCPMYGLFCHLQHIFWQAINGAKLLHAQACSARAFSRIIAILGTCVEEKNQQLETSLLRTEGIICTTDNFITYYTRLKTEKFRNLNECISIFMTIKSWNKSPLLICLLRFLSAFEFAE